MSDDLPHCAVWARLGVSALHGVGVFAVRAIPRGTSVFSNDGVAIVWVDADEIDAAPMGSALRKLYTDFSVRRDGLLGCPPNFNMLTTGWYVNEPEAGKPANLTVDFNFAMKAIRDIEEGEELTADYSTYSK